MPRNLWYFNFLKEEEQMLKIIKKLVHKKNNIFNNNIYFSQEHCNSTELNKPVKTTVTIPNCVKRLFQKITHELMNVILDEDNLYLITGVKIKPERSRRCLGAVH